MSRAQRALVAVQDSAVIATTKKLFKTFLSSHGFSFVGYVPGLVDCSWSPSIDVANDLIKGVCGNPKTRTEALLRVQERSRKACRLSDASRIANDFDEIRALLERLNENPRSSHSILFHVPGESEIRWDLSLSVSISSASKDLTIAFEECVFDLLDFW